MHLPRLHAFLAGWTSYPHQQVLTSSLETFSDLKPFVWIYISENSSLGQTRSLSHFLLCKEFTNFSFMLTCYPARLETNVTDMTRMETALLYYTRFNILCMTDTAQWGCIVMLHLYWTVWYRMVQIHTCTVPNIYTHHMIYSHSGDSGLYF